jgi:prepilin peptidase CpaA
MRHLVELIPLTGFAALMTAAAFEDVRRLVIPNAVILGLCVLWPIHLWATPDVTLSAGLAALGCASAVFFAGALLFSQGLIGGGDVKLLTAATLWAGPTATLPLLALTGLLGGLLSLILLLPVGWHFIGVRPTAPVPIEPVAIHIKAAPVPYGVAIAAAALIVTISQHFSQ